MKAKISIIGGFLVSAALLFLAFRNIDLSALASIYAAADHAYLVPVLLLVLCDLFLRALRWKILVSAAKPVRLWDAFRLQASGLALNNILPLRLGELARAAFGARVFGLPLLTVLATIVVERSLDTLLLFFIFLLAARYGGLGSGLDVFSGYFWPILSALAAAMALLVFADEVSRHRSLSPFFSRFPRLQSVVSSLALGAKALRRPSTAFLALLVGFAQWMVSALNFMVAARAFGIGETVDLFRGMALVFAGAAAASVPGMPGYFGNFELVLKKVLTAWGVDGGVALAYVSYLHLLSYVFMTLIGVACIYAMGHSLAGIWKDFKDAR